MATNPIVQLIIRGAKARGLDPNAVLAVARQEGLGGGVGDGGHAFGPFQLNDAGGVLTGRPGDHRAFAESPAGINWALDQIAGVARGKTGAAAVNAIVRQFERPANPDAEVARALRQFGGGGITRPHPSHARSRAYRASEWAEHPFAGPRFWLGCSNRTECPT